MRREGAVAGGTNCSTFLPFACSTQSLHRAVAWRGCRWKVLVPAVKKGGEIKGTRVSVCVGGEVYLQERAASLWHWTRPLCSFLYVRWTHTSTGRKCTKSKLGLEGRSEHLPWSCSSTETETMANFAQFKGVRVGLQLPKETIKEKVFTPLRAMELSVLTFQELPAQSIQILVCIL